MTRESVIEILKGVKRNVMGISEIALEVAIEELGKDIYAPSKTDLEKLKECFDEIGVVYRAKEIAGNTYISTDFESFYFSTLGSYIKEGE